MPVVKTPLSLGMKNSFSPYNMSNYTSRLDKVAPLIRIRTPSLDMPHLNHELVPYEGFDESQFSITQWMSAGPLFTEGDIYDSPPCPPSFVAQPHGEDHLVYDEFDGNAYTWSYNNHTGYDAAFSSLPEPSGFSNTTFSPTISIVSCSPRSEHSGVSMSPQPNSTEYATAFNFDFATTLPHEFPSSSSSPWSSPSLNNLHSPKSSKSHSPSPSCSSLDVDLKSSLSKSRDSSPGEKEAAQQQRRRFPCLILGCERRFTSQYTLKVHMEAHKPKPRTFFPCTLGCSERFSRQHDRLRHEVAKHGKVCEFLCDECGRFFSTKKTLGNHKCPIAQGGTRWVSN